jgi:hypothetical protein
VVQKGRKGRGNGSRGRKMGISIDKNGLNKRESSGKRQTDEEKL